MSGKDENEEPAPTRIVLKATWPSVDKRRLAADTARLHKLLGELVRWWALLHDQLASVFMAVTGCEWWLSNAMWHSLKSDLAQRQLLSAALVASKNRLLGLRDDLPERFKVPVYDELIWTVNQITEFSHKRNDFVHAPIVIHIGHPYAEFEAEISNSTDDPRARKLAGRELYQYCAWCTAFAKGMRLHLVALTPRRARTIARKTEAAAAFAISDP